jgi:hypothetical protein
VVGDLVTHDCGDVSMREETFENIQNPSKLTLHDVVTVCNEPNTDSEGHYSNLPERNSLPEESVCC